MPAQFQTLSGTLMSLRLGLEGERGPYLGFESSGGHVEMMKTLSIWMRRCNAVVVHEMPMKTVHYVKILNHDMPFGLNFTQPPGTDRGDEATSIDTSSASRKPAVRAIYCQNFADLRAKMAGLADLRPFLVFSNYGWPKITLSSNLPYQISEASRNFYDVRIT